MSEVSNALKEDELSCHPDPLADSSKFSDLQEAANRNLVDFIETDLALCFTFADLARTEARIGNSEAAHRALEKAETGYETMERFLPRVIDTNRQGEFEQRLAELRSRIRIEKGRLGAS